MSKAAAARTFAIRTANFLVAVKRLYKVTGGRKLPYDRIQVRVDICTRCEHFTGKGCSECGCGLSNAESIFNKAAYPTERCPHPDAPRWLEEEL